MKYFLAGNWKMHKTVAECLDYVESFAPVADNSSNKVMVAAPFTALYAMGQKIKEKASKLLLGSQNMAAAESGAHTGEVSPAMLKDCGVDVVILGHSERRAIYGESDELINTKVKLGLAHGFHVILCVGETLEEREAGKAEAVCRQQLLDGLKDVSEAQLEMVTIAYEPVWAIGTGKTATPADANAIHGSIRKDLEAAYSVGAAQNMCIQYGGSVKPGNVVELMAMEHINGALVGGASLKTEDFTSIVNFDRV